MKFVIKKLYLAITLLSISSISYASGDYRNSSSCGDSSACAPCQPVCCSKAYIGAELLYWRAFESGLETCDPEDVFDSVGSDGFVTSTFSGRGHEPHFKWSPGFRIDIGFEVPPCNNWDILTTWTHFQSHNSHNGNRPRWNVKLDVIDVVGVYNWKVGSSFEIMPFAGVRFARIDQKLHIHDFSNSTGLTSNTLIAEESSNKQRFKGLGPILGLAGVWDMGCQFSLYANASVSWLYGKFHVRETEFEEIIDGSNYCEFSAHPQSTQVVLDAGLGVRWETCFCMDTQLILQFGLEHHRYFDHNRIGCYGDLNFDGINLSAGLEF